MCVRVHGTVWCGVVPSFPPLRTRKVFCLILRMRVCVSLKDIRDCYVGIEKDVHDLMISGDIIMIGKEFG